MAARLAGVGQRSVLQAWGAHVRRQRRASSLLAARWAAMHRDLLAACLAGWAHALQARKRAALEERCGPQQPASSPRPWGKV